MSANLVLSVLNEALKHFGSITDANQAEVTLWVRKRVNELHGKPDAEIKPFEPKTMRSWYEPGGDR